MSGEHEWTTAKDNINDVYCRHCYAEHGGLSAPCLCAEDPHCYREAAGEVAAAVGCNAQWPPDDARVDARKLISERDSLRAELQTARDEIAQHDLWREEAYRQIAELRAKVETLTAALQPFADMHRDGCDPNELACERGYSSLATRLYSRDFELAAKTLQPQEKGTA